MAEQATIDSDRDSEDSDMPERMASDIAAGVREIETFDDDPDRFDWPDLEGIAEEGTPLWKRIVWPAHWKESRQDVRKVAKAQLGAVETRGTELSAVVIADYGDCDGRGAAGLYTHRFADRLVYVPASHRGSAPDPLDMLQKVADVIAPGVSVYVADLSPNAEEGGEYRAAFGRLAAQNPVYVRDHHEWTRDCREAVGDMIASLRIDHERCATEIVAEADLVEVPEHLGELARLTSVRDLWKDYHEEFDDGAALLADASFNLDFGEYERLVADVGASLHANEDVYQRLMEAQQEKRTRIGIVTETARWSELSGYTVAFAYGHCYASGAGATLIDEGADIAVIVNATGKVSIRTAEDTPIAAAIAEKFGGGGHPCAAGCKPVKFGKGGDEQYVRLWGSRGAPVHAAVGDAIAEQTRLAEGRE